MNGKLENRVALITGTGGGQGRAAAVLFAREGAKVVGCDLKVKDAKRPKACRFVFACPSFLLTSRQMMLQV